MTPGDYFLPALPEILLLEGSVRLGPLGPVRRRAGATLCETAPVTLHEWTVASALIERDGQLLLVRNVRHGGHQDWSTPGGVIDPEDDSILVGLAREVVEETGLILSVSENGYGKRTPLEDYRLTARGRKGVTNMKTTPKIGKVIGILSVKEDSELMIITKGGQIIRIDSKEIRQAGRSTQGVRLVNVEAGDSVAAASLIPDSEVAAEGENQGDLPLQQWRELATIIPTL